MCLRHIQMVQAFTKAPASVEGTRGGRFRLLDGNVLGVFTDLVSLADLWKDKITWDVLVFQMFCPSGELDALCKVSSRPSRYLTRRSLWSGGTTTGPAVSEWAASAGFNTFSSAASSGCFHNVIFWLKAVITWDGRWIKRKEHAAFPVFSMSSLSWFKL